MPEKEFSDTLERAVHAPTIEALCDAIQSLINHPDWPYDYGLFPAWGPLTEAVIARIHANGDSGDLVSWDTRDPKRPLYLMRVWYESGFKAFVDDD
jgi:hypothetical protein